MNFQGTPTPIGGSIFWWTLFLTLPRLFGPAFHSAISLLPPMMRGIEAKEFQLGTKQENVNTVLT